VKTLKKSKRYIVDENRKLIFGFNSDLIFVSKKQRKKRKKKHNHKNKKKHESLKKKKKNCNNEQVEHLKKEIKTFFDQFWAGCQNWECNIQLCC
jgi:hypothetical protein